MQEFRPAEKKMVSPREALREKDYDTEPKPLPFGPPNFKCAPKKPKEERS
jgi:hypothetical protein